MKATDKTKTIHTTPKGAWEGGVINERKKASKKQRLTDLTTDLLGNGYPTSNKKQDG